MQDTSRNDDEYVEAGGPYADLIRDLVESGRYGSAAEVLLEGLALLQQREFARKAYDEHMRTLIQVGIDQADRGELIPAEEVFRELRAEIAALAAKSRQ